MSAFLLLLVCPFLGWVFGRFHWMPQGSHAAINAWVLRVAFPALVLAQVPELAWDSALIFAIAGPWIVFAGAAILIPVIGRAAGWDRSSIGALVLTCGLGNTAFVGLPMIGALAGPQALGPALIADQLGSFLALSTAGVVFASIYAGDQIDAREVTRRLLRFPPFLALVAAMLVRLLGGWPEEISMVLHRLGDTLTPLALFSIGLSFKFGALRGRGGMVLAGLGWKLFLAPLAAFLVALVAGVGGTAMMAGVLQSAQGPMITAGILAQEHRLNPDLVTLIVGTGVLMSFVTAPLWFLFLR